MAVAVDGHLRDGERKRTAEAILPLGARCPARGLELVVYSARTLADAARPPELELNLNAGPRIDTRVEAHAAPGEEHWFVLDLAIARERGQVVYGAPPAQLIAPRPDAEIRAALRASLAWHAANRPEHPDTVLNACRAWLWLSERRWASKRSAASWASGRAADGGLVEGALRARGSGAALPAARVRGLLAEVERAAAA